MAAFSDTLMNTPGRNLPRISALLAVRRTVALTPSIVPSRDRQRAGLLGTLRARGAQFLVMAAGAMLLACGLHQLRPGFVEALDSFGLQAAFQLRGARTPLEVAEKLPQSRDIVTIELPPDVPRPLLARVLGELRLARAVGVDLMLLDRESLLLAQHLPPDEECAWYGREHAGWRRDTNVLAAQLRRMPRAVVGTWPEQERVVDPHAPTRSFFRAVWHRPASLIWNAARHHAHLTILSSEAGTVRAVNLWQPTGDGHREPCMGLSLAALARGTTPQALARDVPCDASGAMLIDYLGGRECFDFDANRVVYARVLDGTYDAEDFQGKIVLLGENSLASKEIKSTPFGPMPGMHVHAMIAATLLASHGAPRLLSLPVCALLALACCGLMILPLAWWPAWSSWLSAGLQCVALVLGGGWLFAATERVLPLSVPLLALLFALNGVSFLEYRRARTTLGRFIGNEMPRALRSFGPGPRLGGHITVASAFFCDLRGYSELAASLPLPTLSQLMNEYTGALVKVVRAHGGRPIDFQGDGMFVLFEPGEHDDTFAERAVLAALEVQRTLVTLRPRWDSLGVPPFDVAIAIATGPMMIGMVGGEEHLKPGAVGDAVNVAARLQRLSARCGFDVLLTRETWERARERVEAMPCGLHLIKGHREPLEVWGVGEPSRSCTLLRPQEMPPVGAVSRS